jgi:hypothetical protein
MPPPRTSARSASGPGLRVTIVRPRSARSRINAPFVLAALEAAGPGRPVGQGFEGERCVDRVVRVGGDDQEVTRSEEGPC